MYSVVTARPAHLSAALLLSLLTLLLGSCSRPRQTAEADTADTLLQATDTARTRILLNLPHPVQVAQLLKLAGAQYMPGQLHRVSELPKYQSSQQMALNLGIYAADLAYANVFDQKQEALRYFDAVRQLATGLRLNSIFNDALLKRLQRNENQADSLTSIATETLSRVRLGLQRDGQGHLEGLMAAGGWTEGVYLASLQYKARQRPELASRIAEQRSNLEKLLELLKAYPEDPQVKVLRPELEKLQRSFAQIKITYSSGTAQIDPTTRRVTIGNRNTVQVDPAAFEAIHQQVSRIRQMMINSPAA